MGKLFKTYLRSHNLDTKTDEAYFNCINPYFETEEFKSLEQYIQHGDINRIQHIQSVAYLSYKISKKLKKRHIETTIGALLHDLFYYDWHEKDISHKWHGYVHPGFALENAKELSKKINRELSDIEKNIIERHMWPLTLVPPKHIESYIVCMVDKYVSIAEIIICKSEKLKRKYLLRG